MSEVTDNTNEVDTHNIFNDYLKLQKKYNLLKTEYDTLQSKLSAVLMAWDKTWDLRELLINLQTVLKDHLGGILDGEIDRKND